MGYADNTKGYRVYNKLSKKIEISRTIQLQENNTTNNVQIQFEDNYRSVETLIKECQTQMLIKKWMSMKIIEHQFHREEHLNS